MKHKDMLSVRNGTYKSNDEALEEYSEGADLIGSDMLGSDIDMLLVDREAKRIQTYYEGQNQAEEGLMKSKEWKAQAIKNINEQFK